MLLLEDPSRQRLGGVIVQNRNGPLQHDRPSVELASLREENADIRRRLLDGELLPNVAAVAVQSINTDIRALGAAMKAREQEELLERLEALEQSREGGRRRWG